MALERLGRPVRVLLLDSVWPYEVSANVLRLQILRRLMREVEPTDDIATAVGPSKYFDLIAIRESLFFRYALNAYYRFGRDGEEFLDFLVRDNVAQWGEIPDESFNGYGPRSDSFRYDIPLITRSLTKIIFHNPLTGRAKRSYTAEREDESLPHMEPNISPSYGTAFGRGKGGLLFDDTVSDGLFPLVLLARDESRRLFPHDSILIVEVNSILSQMGTGSSEFVNWFKETRSNEIFDSHHALLANTDTYRQDFNVISEEERIQDCRMKVERFEEALQDLEEKMPSYIDQELQGIEYHDLQFGSEILVKELENKRDYSLLWKAHESLDLWKSIRACARSLQPPSPPPYAVHDSATFVRPLKLLSFDGGGLEGLALLIAVQKLLKEVGKEGHLEETPLPCDYFDMIAGTGTGGLIALLLGRLKLSGDDCITVYEDILKEVFRDEQTAPLSSRFSAKIFEETLRAKFRKVLGINHDEVFLHDPDIMDGDGCPVFVVAIDRERFSEAENTVLLRTYDTKSDATFEQSCYLWESILATCASPVAFFPVHVKGRILLASSLGFNNPTELLITEAKTRWPGRPISAVVSIGTGNPRVNLEARDMESPTEAMQLLASHHIAATSSRATDSAVYEYFQNIEQQNCYFRFNIDCALSLEFHEYGKSAQIQRQTTQYLDSNTNLFEICAQKLEGRETQSLPRSHQQQHPTPTTDLPGDDLESSMSTEEAHTLLNQYLILSAPLPIDLKPIYQLDARPGSARTKTISLDSATKLRSTTTAVGRARASAIRPMGGLALSFELVEAQTSLRFGAAEQQRLVRPGVWRVHWVLLFHRFPLSDDTALVDTSPVILAREAGPVKLQLSARVLGHGRTEDGDGDDDTQVLENISSAVEIAYPATTLAGERWRDVAMGELLHVPRALPRDGEGDGVEVEFGIEWGTGTWGVGLGRRWGWRGYFGGIRLVPIYGDGEEVWR